MGVSGFLISCAMRRATSAQADVRCAATNSVMSSIVTTEPWLDSLDCSLVMRTDRLRSRPLRVIVTWSCVRAPEPVSYTHLRAHETRHDLVCRLLLEQK